MRWPVDVPVDPDELRRRAAEILARDEFQPPRRSVWQRIGSWIGRQLSKLFGLLRFGGGTAGSVVGWLIVLVALAGLVALVVWGVRRARRRARPDADDEQPAVVVADRRAADWRVEAADHAAHGRWREALRCRYRALVADLAERGLVDPTPGRTTGDERRQVADRVPTLGPPFGGFADTFDRVVYGDEPATPDDVARVDALDATVRATERLVPHGAGDEEAS